MKIKPALVAIVFCGFFGLAIKAGAETPIACNGTEWKTRPEFDMDLKKNLPRDDYFDILWQCQHTKSVPSRGDAKVESATAYPAPDSPWATTDRSRHLKTLVKTHTDVLVIPFQIQGYGLSRIERAIMTADLSYELGQYATTADPFLVSRVFGEGIRRIEYSAIKRVGEQLNSKYIVTSYVGHENRSALTVSISVLEMKDGKVLSQRTKDWISLPFSDRDPPFMVVHRLLPDIVREIGIATVGKRQVTNAAPAEFQQTLNVTPAALMREDTRKVSPLQASLFLAAIATPSAERSSERLNIRALLTALRSRTRSPSVRFAEAYALMNLDHRPLALELLSGLTTPRENALTALLNGNLPLSEKARGDIKYPFERLLIDLAIKDLREKYGRKADDDLTYVQELFGDRLPDWSPALFQRYSDAEPWGDADAQDIKRFLDTLFPIAEFDLLASQQGNVLLQKGWSRTETDVDIASAKHIRKVMDQSAPTVCCTIGTFGVNSDDTLTLVEGQLESRIAKRLYRSTGLRGLPQESLTAIDQYSPYFDGNPLFENARAEAAAALVKKATDDSRDHWLRLVTSSATTAAYYSYGASRLSASSLETVGALFHEMTDAYGYDYPRRSFWPGSFIGLDSNRSLLIALMNEGLAYSRSDLVPLYFMAGYLGEKEREAYKSELAGRFVGLQGRETYFRRPTGMSGLTDREASFRDAIAADPGDWSNYNSLGRMLFNDGKFDEAAQVFKEYPPFKQPHSQDRIAVANRAYEVGSLFFWRGSIDHAKWFYKVSADLDTGSEGSMASAIRLKILAGDYAGAAKGSAERASRYDDPYAYRDYLSLLHAQGFNSQAWLGFAQIQSSFELPQVWVSALVGHRKEGTDEKTMLNWLRQADIRNAKHGLRRVAPWYALIAFTTDRDSPENLGKLVAELEPEPVAQIDASGRYGIPIGARPQEQVRLIAPSDLRMSRTLPVATGTKIQSDLVYFAEAYDLLRKSEFEKSATAFVAMADRYQIERDYGYALPYFALAAAKSGDVYKLEEFLKSHVDPSNFDQWLAKAFFAGVRKDVDAAETALSKAFIFLPYTDYRPILSEYQYADACERIYKETQDKRFVDFILRWTKQYQLIQPTHAWAYSMQYTYETDPTLRMKALAMTILLDPLSPRIAKASADETTKAKAWLKTHNPFSVSVTKFPYQASAN